jgi:hypothetical protein
MAQSAAANLTLGTAHRRITTTISGIDTFLQCLARAGSLDRDQGTEAGNLRRTLEHRLGYLKILWYAESTETQFGELKKWITGVAGEVERIINVMTVFMRALGTRLKTDHDDKGQSISDHPTGVAAIIQEMETMADAQIGLDTDTVEMCEALTPQEGGTEERQFKLSPTEVSTMMITIPTEQFNQRFDETVHHPGGAGVDAEEKGKEPSAQFEKGHLAHLESHRHLRASYIARGGSDDHLAHACETRQTLHAKENGHPTQARGKPTTYDDMTEDIKEYAQETNFPQETTCYYRNPGDWGRPSRKSIVKNHKDNTLTYAQTSGLFYIGQATRPERRNESRYYDPITPQDPEPTQSQREVRTVLARNGPERTSYSETQT